MDECLRYDGMNFCPFSQYFMVHDVAYDMYLNRDYSNIIFQVLTDNYSHKRKGVLGVRKLENICSQFNINRIRTIDEIDNNNHYILPDSGDNNLFNEIIEKFHIEFKFRESHQGKMPDLLIKINDIFLIIEHKILKESGGGQDKQMTEIIDFIGHGERGVHYISFMDGILFNGLISPRTTNKLYRDKINIISNLQSCPFNYFVNEYGFNKVIDNILNR